MDLASCPFCGETEKIAAYGVTQVCVSCQTCGAGGPQDRSAIQAAANWNRRPASMLTIDGPPTGEPSTPRHEAMIMPARTGLIHFEDGSSEVGTIAPHLAIPVSVPGLDDLTQAREKRELAGLPSVSTTVQPDGLSMDFDLGGEKPKR